MAMVGVDDSSPEDYLGEAQVAWLGLSVDNHSALFYIHQMNRVNSRNEFVMITV